MGPVLTLKALTEYAKSMGLFVQGIHLRGKVHNPENKQLADKLGRFCESHASFTLPRASELRVPLRSNQTGELLRGSDSLTMDCVQTILAARCEWHTLMKEMAKDLKGSGETSHTIASFGIGDVIPMAPFNQVGVQITKLDVRSLAESALPTQISQHTEYQYPDNAVAIIGAGCRVPGANSLQELWKLLSRGDSTCQPVPPSRIDITGNFRAKVDGKMDKRSYYGNFIDNAASFDNAFFHISPKEAQHMDPQQRLLLEVAYQALESSGYLATHDRAAGDAVGCFIAASFVEYLENAACHGPTAFTSTGTLRAFLCGRLSYHFGWTGPSEVIDTACSASLVAINRACKAVQSGECPVALAGGVNLMAGAQNFLDLGKAGFLSETGQCKPFDARADGYCRSEGAGLVVLKPLKHALRDGDPVLGVVAGVATNQGGLSASLTVPSGDAQVALYRNVLRQSHLRPEDVTYAEAHGTGTQAGDPLEVESLREVFGGAQRRRPLRIGSVKGNIGHLETAAGVAGLLKVLAMMKHGKIPKQASFESLNPKIPALEPDGLAIATAREPWDAPLKASLVSSYGAAGSNAAMICCQPPPPPTRQGLQRHQGTKFPLRVSAASERSLSASLAVLKSHLSQHGSAVDIANLSLTLSERRKKHEYQWTTTATSIAEVVSAMATSTASVKPLSAPARGVVLLFSGQSKQNVHLNRSLYDSQPLLRRYVDLCDEMLTQQGFPSIIPSLFQEEAISDPVILQCATFALQYSCAKCWIDSGLKVDVIVGHSFGELTALAVSGALSLRDGILLVATRATLMKTKWGAERGTMLAIHADRQTVEKVQRMVPDIEVACYNAPTSQVVVGTAASITETERVLSSNFPAVKHQRLNVSHGFHSRFTEPLLPGLGDLSAKLSFGVPSIPVETCTEDRVSIAGSKYLTNHTRMPVYFEQAIQRVETRLGPCVFLEAGTDTPIVAMAKRATARSDGHVFQALSSHKDAHGLAAATASLWQQNVSVSFWAFASSAGIDTPRLQQVWLPPYQFDKSTTAWLPFVDRIEEAKAMQKPCIEPATQPHKPQFLVSPVSVSEGRFLVNTGAERFTTLVSGHAVRGKPLCPASLYMECALMAVQLAGKDVQGKSLVFSNVSYSAPLGIDASRETFLSLDQPAAQGPWRFSLSSTALKKRDTHATGNLSIGVQASPQNQLVERLVADRMKALKARQDVDTFSSMRAYSLFSRVVRYSAMFRGISNIVMDADQALATVNVPPCTAEPGQSTVTRSCETVVLDTFIQVLGLLVNSGTHVDDECVCVATGVESATISAAADFDAVREYTVYAMYNNASQGRFSGDVFVMARGSGELVCSFAGVQFSQLPIVKLERLLEGANSTAVEPATSQPTPMRRGVFQPSNVEILPTYFVADESAKDSCVTTSEETPSGDVRSADAVCETLKNLISTYNSLPAASIQNDASMADLGIDSLAAVELSEDISSEFDITISSNDVLCGTVQDIVMLVLKDQPAAAASAKVQQIPRLVIPEQTKEPSAPSASQSNESLPKVLHMVHEATGAPINEIRHSDRLADLGADSLSFVELKHELEHAFGLTLDEAGISTASTVQDILNLLTPADDTASSATTDSGYQTPETDESITCVESDVPADAPRVCLDGAHMLLAQSMDTVDTNAKESGFTRYWADTNPAQESLLVAYIVEAFADMGADLRALTPGQLLPELKYNNKHNRLVGRFFKILEESRVVERIGQTYARAAGALPRAASSKLSADFARQHPAFACEAQLMALTGPHLAACLSGRADPVALLFGSPAAQETVARFYRDSPMMAAMTEQLVAFLERVLQRGGQGAVVRILEVGAGSGGTTTRVAELLEQYVALRKIEVQYVFTDVSAKLVRKAAAKFAHHRFMSFEMLDLETVAAGAVGSAPFDVIIGTNCVHATSDRMAVCARLRTLLRPESGLLVLSEITDVANWYDSVFGLLDGWWMDCSGAYAIQPASSWMTTFQKAGFASWSYSTGHSRESNSQQLLIASNRAVAGSQPSPAAKSLTPHAPEFSVETVVYKTVDDTPIHADIYYPARRLTTPKHMAIGTSPRPSTSPSS